MRQSGWERGEEEISANWRGTTRQSQGSALVLVILLEGAGEREMAIAFQAREAWALTQVREAIAAGKKLHHHT
jgi:hypothetical protein